MVKTWDLYFDIEIERKTMIIQSPIFKTYVTGFGRLAHNEPGKKSAGDRCIIKI
jgi:hypothetical protein